MFLAEIYLNKNKENYLLISLKYFFYSNGPLSIISGLKIYQ